MKLLNDTSNQHYLSQVEQRLNTCNPGALRRNQKIYAYEIENHGTNKEIKLGPAAEKSIASNLSMQDLFSFDVAPTANLRQNFELLFHRHEQQLQAHTEALLKKAEMKSADIAEELIALFAAKLLNFMRNPYSVPKMLDTFRRIVGLRPTDPEQDRLLGLVLNGRKPHQAATCKRLGISDIQYRHWLGTLFMMLSELSPGQETLFNGLARATFTHEDHAVGVMISMYTHDKCLLSDRSFSTHVQDARADGMDFNLQHNAFIRFIFASRTALLAPNRRPALVTLAKTLPPRVSVYYFVDDLTLLQGYNLNVIRQSHSHVYCAARDGIVF